MTVHKINAHVLAWIEAVEQGKIEACKDQHQLVAYVRLCFETEDIYTDGELLDKYIRQENYFPFQLVPWEKFCIALHLCTFWTSTDRPRWPDLFLLIGRGAGKDAYIGFVSYCLISPHSGLPEYDVDICANVESQALRPVLDVVAVLNNPQNRLKLSKYFRWTAEHARGIKYNGIISGHTKAPSSKDGLRSGMVVFNEIHQYENYANIKVFVTGLGKKKHPRRLYATTNGDVRDGPLDDMIERAEKILQRGAKDNGLLPFICRLDKKEYVHDPKYWPQANPTLPYNEDLLVETEKEYREWLEDPGTNPDFMTKRMNLPQTAAVLPVTDYENVQATCVLIKDDGVKERRELPDLRGWYCTCGIDYASIADWASVNLHFKKGDLRYDINHSWFNKRSKDLPRIKAPWKKWEEAGLLTVVDDVEIDPALIGEWIQKMGSQYMIQKWAMDNFRYPLMKRMLREINVDPDDFKNLHLVRPSDIMKVQPVIQSMFAKQQLIWGDQPALRWATNNTKLVRSGKKQGTDTGNFYYAKIDAKKRKNDPFMAFVASVVIEDEIPDFSQMYNDLPVIVC